MEIGGIVMTEDIFNEKKVEHVKVETKKEDAEEKILEKAIKEVKKVESTKEYEVICTRLNIRKNASESADILGQYESGDKIKVDTNGSVGAFSKVTGPVAGYVMTKFIAPVK